MNIIAVGIGGFFGAICRYIVVTFLITNDSFPLATLFSNLLGCLVLGWFLTMTSQYWKVGTSIRLLVGTGAIGSFTTFSAFSLETLQLLQQQHYMLSLLNIVITIVGGPLLAIVGIKLASIMVKNRGVSNP